MSRTGEKLKEGGEGGVFEGGGTEKKKIKMLQPTEMQVHLQKLTDEVCELILLKNQVAELTQVVDKLSKESIESNFWKTFGDSCSRFQYFFIKRACGGLPWSTIEKELKAERESSQYKAHFYWDVLRHDQIRDELIKMGSTVDEWERCRIFSDERNAQFHERR